MKMQRNKIHAGKRDVFKGAISYVYHQVVLESGKVTTTRTSPEKVAITVATFWNEDYTMS